MNIKKIIQKLDLPLLLPVGLLVTIGLFMVFSATHSKITGQPFYYLSRQAGAALLGLLAGFAVLFFDYRISAKTVYFLYGLNILLLVLVLFIGKEVNGARSWLFFFQPSEFSKLVTIITLAKYLAERNRLSSFGDLLVPFALMGLPALLIIVQPNLGTALVFIFFTFLMLYAAGFPGRKLLALIFGGIFAIALLFLSHQYLHTPLPVKAYQIDRLTNFTHPDRDPNGTGWQLNQAMIAVGSGQFSGKGYLRGTQGRLGYLPESHTDFIFSVLSEELGFVGSFGVLLLYFIFIWRGLRIASLAKEENGCLIATGITAMFLFHVLENIGMNMGIMPVAGIPLPFISFGGTSMVINLVSIGFIANIWIRHQKISF